MIDPHKLTFLRTVSHILITFGTLMSTGCSEKTASKVGDFSITQKMVNYREEVAKIYYPNENRKVGLQQLKNAYVLAQILKNHGSPVTEAILLKEEKRIELKSNNHAMLDQVKKVFGTDQRAYLEVFILPVYVSHFLHEEFFTNLFEIQNASREKARLFYLKVSENPKNFLKDAHATGVPLEKLCVSHKNGFQRTPLVVPDRSKEINKFDFPRANNFNDQSTGAKEKQALLSVLEKVREEEVDQWIKEIALPLHSGQLSPSIIDERENWLVLRSLGIEKGTSEKYCFEVAKFARPQFQKWLDKEAANVKITDIIK